MKKEPRESSSTSDSFSTANSSEVSDFFLFFFEALVLALTFLAVFSCNFLFQKAELACVNQMKIRSMQFYIMMSKVNGFEHLHLEPG